MLIIAIKTHKAWNFTTFQRASGNKISSNSVGKLNPIMLPSFFWQLPLLYSYNLQTQKNGKRKKRKSLNCSIIKRNTVQYFPTTLSSSIAKKLPIFTCKKVVFSKLKRENLSTLPGFVIDTDSYTQVYTHRHTHQKATFKFQVPAFATFYTFLIFNWKELNSIEKTNQRAEKLIIQTGNGKAIYKNRTLTHNLQKHAQEVNLPIYYTAPDISLL